MVRALIFIALGQAWNIVAGIGGQLSLGHGVFLGLGCYTTGILFNKFGVPPWIGGFAGTLISLAVALVMGSMTLRLRGVFFALATVAVSLALVQLSRHFVDLTGGADGLALKFVGTSLWAMQSRSPTPFLYAGLWYGMVSAALALIIVAVVETALAAPLQQLVASYDHRFAVHGLGAEPALATVAIGAVLGWTGAWFAASRHLARSTV